MLLRELRRAGWRSYRALLVWLAFPQEPVGRGSYNSIWPLQGGHIGLRDLVVRLPTKGGALVNALGAQRKQLCSSLWLGQEGNGGPAAVVGVLPVLWSGGSWKVLRDDPSSELDIRAALQVGLVYRRGKDAEVMTEMLAETVRAWRSTPCLACMR